MFRKGPPSLIVSHRDPAVRERIRRLSEGPLLASGVRGRVKVRVKRPKSPGAVVRILRMVRDLETHGSRQTVETRGLRLRLIRT